MQFWLIWPFLLWGGLIAMCYGVGYALLGLVNEPMALFNIVNYMAVVFKYDIYQVQVRCHLHSTVLANWLAARPC
jgi:hypothetical protein